MPTLRDLRGQEYCNCSHARALRDEIENIYVNAPVWTKDQISDKADQALGDDHQLLLRHLRDGEVSV